ncbi:SCO family protein [Deinococcus sp. YIM 77859]|uniref:SCO family protein n=1 Tax=Deinococcus sp. YIM 77859 TaxID=1540221 RepID=UPI000558FA05|nr:SCO family protein [Deinococcus sp. YIM 77859]
MSRLLTALLLAVALVLSGVLVQRAYLMPLGGSEVDTRPLVPDVPLTGQDNRTHRLSDWAGQTRVVVFGYTRCPNLTPIVLKGLAEAAARLTPAHRARLRIILVTVDPGTDTPSRLRKYLHMFPNTFRGLTGTEQALDVTRQGFYVHAYREPGGQINHGDSIAIVDQDGHFRRFYFPLDVMDGTLTRDLPHLIDAYS